MRHRDTVRALRHFARPVQDQTRTVWCSICEDTAPEVKEGPCKLQEPSCQSAEVSPVSIGRAPHRGVRVLPPPGPVRAPVDRPALPPRDHLYTADRSRLTASVPTGCRGFVRAILCVSSQHFTVRHGRCTDRWGHGSHNPQYVTRNSRNRRGTPATASMAK